jgi:hypothetical protein
MYIHVPLYILIRNFIFCNKGEGPSGRVGVYVFDPRVNSQQSTDRRNLSTDDPQLLYGTSPPLPPLKPHDVQPHPQKTIGNNP